jgi:RNA polymerase sigma-70 factor (ECF subfamily)
MDDERQAIARLKRGDLAGLEVLVRRYQVQAVHAAYLVVHERALAEDVVQAAFLHAAEKIGQFDDTRPFGPWFLRSVIHAAVKAAHRQQRLASLDAEPQGEALSLANWLADPHPGPEEIVESEETRRAVWRGLEQLLPEQRAVIVLRHFLELSEAETAEELHRPLSTVKWWLHTARQRLRKMLHPGLASGREEIEDQGKSSS